VLFETNLKCVRHAARYVDIPVPEKDQFAFWIGNHASGERARTLRPFLNAIERRSSSELDGHRQREDFSTWIGDVFGDYALAEVVRGIERDYGDGKLADIVPRLADAVRSRYDFIGPLTDRGRC